jgi:lipoate---protein ligase
MKLLDLTLPTPAENLALDEALLDACDSGQGGEVLRFWESPQYFVVVGYANKIDVEVNRPACEAAGVPILRRCSGGGTVVQGAGCFNYSLILRIADHPQLETIPQTNCFIMNRQAAALRTIVDGNIEVRGHTDLALDNIKFSGNAQRRKREALIFHGTFLLNFDLSLAEKLLRMPSKEPDYRQNRSHLQFLTNLLISKEKVKAAVQKVWAAEGGLEAIPSVTSLVEQKYGRNDWNFKF